MGVYFHFAKLKLLVFLTYRFEVFTSLVSNLIITAAGIYLWKTAYKGIGSVQGVSESQMLIYTIMAVLLASFFSNNVEDSLQNRITQGNIAIDLFRPVNLFLVYLAEDIGIAFSSLASKLLPLFVIVSVFVKVPLPYSLEAFICFMFSSIFSFMILWLISASIALLCFWVLQLGELKTIKGGIILLLSGKIIPLWLFPESIQRVLEFLPFQYIYQTPLSIYIGKLTPSQAVPSMMIQLVWIILFACLLSFGWSKAQKRVLIQGG